jgi:hypothetical protein
MTGGSVYSVAIVLESVAVNPRAEHAATIRPQSGFLGLWDSLPPRIATHSPINSYGPDTPGRQVVEARGIEFFPTPGQHVAKRRIPCNSLAVTRKIGSLRGAENTRCYGWHRHNSATVQRESKSFLSRSGTLAQNTQNPQNPEETTSGYPAPSTVPACMSLTVCVCRRIGPGYSVPARPVSHCGITRSSVPVAVVWLHGVIPCERPGTTRPPAKRPRRRERRPLRDPTMEA